MTRKSIHLFFMFCMLLTLALPMVIQAQDDANVLNQRAQLRDTLVNQASQLLQKYNIPFKELDNLLPFVAQNDQAGLMNKLGSLGLSQEQIGGMLQEASPLIQQGLSSGIIQEYLGQLAVNQLQEAQVGPENYDAYFKNLSDPKLMEQMLGAAGIDQNELFKFVQRAEELRQMGLGADDFDRYVRVEAIAQAISESNFSEDQWNGLIDAYFAQPEVFDAQLQAAGIDPEAFVDSFLEAYTGLYSGYGFDEEEMDAFITQAFLENLAEAGDDPDALAAVLWEYGFSDDEAAAFIEAAGDPEAMMALLGEYGFSEDDLAAFVSAVEDSGDATTDDQTGSTDESSGGESGTDESGGESESGESEGESSG